MNVFYCIVTPGGNTPGQVIADVAAWFKSFYVDAINPVRLPSSWSLDYTTVTYRDAEDSTVRVRVADAVAGDDEGTDQDAQVAYLINWATSDPRRGGKPRQYVCGVIDEVMADSAFISTAVQTSMSSDINTWLESALAGFGPNDTPMQLVEMSFTNGKAFRDAAVTFPIIGGTLNPVVATQRRRVDRRRPT